MTKDEINSYLAEAEYEYTETGTSPISDDVYDALARSVDRKVVGAAANHRDLLTHETPMLSLENLKTNHPTDMSSLHDWVASIRKACPEISDAEWVAEPKLDGLALRVVYNSGMLVEAALRGSKSEGRNVTSLVLESGLAPAQVDHQGKFEVRGEVYIPEALFQEFNREMIKRGTRSYKTARNSVAGWISKSNVEILRELCKFSVYDVIGLGENYLDSKAQVREMGFVVTDSLCVFSMAVYEPAIAIFSRSLEWRNGNRELPRWDGVVYKLVNKADRDLLERKFDRSESAMNTSPCWAIAHKFPPEEVVTRCVGVFRTTGIDGRITPMVSVEPVQLGGTTVSKCTVHSMERFETLGIDVGSLLVISRRGDVIPHVESVVDFTSRACFLPPLRFRYRASVCPSCGGELVRDGAHDFCRNVENCPDQEGGRIMRFTSRHGLYIDDIGIERIKLLIAGRVIQNGVVDFYDPAFVDLAAVSLGSEVVAKKLGAAFEYARTTTPLNRYLYAMCIPHVGKSVSAKLVKHYGSVVAILEADEDELASVCGFRDHRASELYEALQTTFKLKHRKMLELGFVPVEDIVSSKYVVAVTGKLSRSKTELGAELKSKGIEITSDLNASCYALVVGSDPGSKLKRAEKLEVPIWDESMLWEFVNSLC